ncbi:hypothetical protein GBA52_028055 [Prunus armeniaca]|nr:hypothetical protein GBA52_028055 [Prunus armeniaca]
MVRIFSSWKMRTQVATSQPDHNVSPGANDSTTNRVRPRHVPHPRRIRYYATFRRRHTKVDLAGKNGVSAADRLLNDESRITSSIMTFSRLRVSREP